MRSPLSVVSDSFGHENEVSKSSEEKMAATGSKVAPRSMGSLFSPMEKAKQAQKAVHLFTKQNHLCSSLGSKKSRGDSEDWEGGEAREM